MTYAPRPRDPDSPFRLESDFEPAGDQPKAIERLAGDYLEQAEGHEMTLLGVTGSGKTFTMAHLIADLGLPTLVISHNKTLAAQLYRELKGFLPHNAVEYYVSYYDYYLPESYIPHTDTYIAKEVSINDELERLRLRATGSLVSRPDTVVVASVSCIYGIGVSRSDFVQRNLLILRPGDPMGRRELFKTLVDLQYGRNDLAMEAGRFRVRGDIIDVHIPGDDHPIRIELWGDEVEGVSRVHLVTGETLERLPAAVIYPARPFVTPRDQIERAVTTIKDELKEQLDRFKADNLLVEAQRLASRTRYDLEMLEELGYCTGIENYSRHFSGKAAGEPPWTLVDYFADGPYLTIVDESHATLPQFHGMYKGDQSRKRTLVDHGFRLTSAMDNRPLMFEEWRQRVDRILYVSATPGDFELERCGGVAPRSLPTPSSPEFAYGGNVVEQIIRPTGLIDPALTVLPEKGQIDDLLGRIRQRVARKERVLVTTLTKRMAEDLCDYYEKLSVRVRYLHSDIDTLERVEILKALRSGEFDVLIGVNLLREGLDLPEVSLVAILDADKEGFLRTARALIQTNGRAARHVNGEVVMYADRRSRAMEAAIAETDRRRVLQRVYNRKHGITPRTIIKAVESPALSAQAEARAAAAQVAARMAQQDPRTLVDKLARLTESMEQHARQLEFEQAARLRDEIREIERLLGG